MLMIFKEYSNKIKFYNELNLQLKILSIQKRVLKYIILCTNKFCKLQFNRNKNSNKMENARTSV